MPPVIASLRMSPAPVLPPSGLVAQIVMSSPAPSARRISFAEAYCAKRNLPLTAFQPSMFRACLHLPAALLHPLIVLLSPDFFAADHDLVANVGQLKHAGDLGLDLEEYRYHPANQSRLRRFFLLCISTERVGQVVRAHLRPARPTGAGSSRAIAG